MSVIVTKDAFIRLDYPDNNYGTGNSIGIRKTDSDERRGILHFDVSTISGDRYCLYLYSTVDVSNVNIRISRLIQTGWVETEVTWNEYSAGNSWTNAGGDYDDTISEDFTVNGTGWKSFDITSLVNDAKNNRANQLHILIRPIIESSYFTTFYSREYSGYEPYIEDIEKTDDDLISSVTESTSVEKTSFDISIANNNRAYILNMKTGYWTYQDNCPFTNVIYRPSNRTLIGARRDKGQISQLNYGSSFDGSDIDAIIKTGMMNLGQLDELRNILEDVDSEALKRLRAFFSEIKAEGNLNLKIYTENDSTGKSLTISVPTTDNSTLNVIRTALSRSIRGKYFQYEISNNNGNDFWLGETKIKIMPRGLR